MTSNIRLAALAGQAMGRFLTKAVEAVESNGDIVRKYAPVPRIEIVGGNPKIRTALGLMMLMPSEGSQCHQHHLS
jgi:hypothetical protein